jgi:hypothetical protein
MKSILWIIAVILVIGWILGVGGLYDAGYLIHILLVLAVISVLLSLIKGDKDI